MQRVVLRCSASPEQSPPLRAFYAPLPDKMPLRHRPASTSPLTHLLQVSGKSDYESRNGPKLSARTPARMFDDTERVCTERSISLDLSGFLMRDSRLLSDDYQGAR